jgi:hypothetical protein
MPHFDNPYDEADYRAERESALEARQQRREDEALEEWRAKRQQRSAEEIEEAREAARRDLKRRRAYFPDNCLAPSILAPDTEEDQ